MEQTCDPLFFVRPLPSTCQMQAKYQRKKKKEDAYYKTRYQGDQQMEPGEQNAARAGDGEPSAIPMVYDLPVATLRRRGGAEK